MDKPPLSQVKRKKILLYSQVIWDDVWQRPQEFAVGASRYADVIYYSPVPWHRYYRIHKKRFAAFRQANPHLQVLSPRIMPGHYRFPPVKKANELFLYRHLRQLHKKHEFDLFFTNSPFVRYLLDIFKDTSIIYDVIDDFIQFSWAPASGEKEEKVLLQKASRCFTGTRTLYERKKHSHNNVSFIPCGVHFEKFNNPQSPCPDDLKDIARPIIGYFGTISDRLDKELITMIADRFPKCSLVFIGPIQASFGSLIKKSNIHYLGLKPHDVLPQYLKEFALCILPFALDEGTKSINPVKLLEFLSGEKIVISTPIPDIVHFYKGIVYLADNHQEFIDILNQQLEKPSRERIRKGVEMARNRSWEAMVKEMLRKAEIVPDA